MGGEGDEIRSKVQNPRIIKLGKKIKKIHWASNRSPLIHNLTHTVTQQQHVQREESSLKSAQVENVSRTAQRKGEMTH